MRQFCILFLGNLGLKKTPKNKPVPRQFWFQWANPQLPCLQCCWNTWFSRVQLYFCNLLLHGQSWLLCVIVLLLRVWEWVPGCCAGCPWQDILVKASGSCGLQITSVKYWDVFMYYKSAFLFFFNVSCSASFACQVCKWDWEGDKSERMKENSGSPLPATAV